MKFCILGAGGCFGINLADYLLKQGHAVIGIGRSPKKPPCFSLGVDYPYWNYHVTHEIDYIMKLLDKEEPEVIVNFAAQGEGAASFNPEDWWRFYETNCTGLAKLTGALTLRQVYGGYWQRFIHIGTSELYGAVTAASKETDPIVPTSPYAASKAAFDMHLLAISKVKSFPMNIVRPSNCVARGQQLHRIVPRALLSALTGRTLELQGGGLARKSFLHATDLSKAILLIAEKAPLGEVYNVGPENPVSILEVVETCAEVAQVPFSKFVRKVADRPGQDSCYWLDSTKVKALGWSETYTLFSAISDIHAWVSEYRSELAALDADFRMRA